MSSERVKEAAALRAETAVHYNCCQSTLIPFREACGLDRERINALGRGFGSGMGYGATCGAVTGAMMALGMAGASGETIRAFRDAFRARHGALNCAELLRMAHEAGEERKCHCDRMVLDAVALADELLGSGEK